MRRSASCGEGRRRQVISMLAGHFNQLILSSFSSGLNSGPPVTSSASFSFASAAAKASARLILKRALKPAALSASARGRRPSSHFAKI